MVYRKLTASHIYVDNQKIGDFKEVIIWIRFAPLHFSSDTNIMKLAGIKDIDIMMLIEINKSTPETRL